MALLTSFFDPSGLSINTVQGDLIYSSGTNIIAGLSKNTSSTRYLANTGTNNDPKWDTVNLANGVTGTLPVSNGGTGVATTTAYGVILAGTTATGAFQNGGVGTAGQVFTSNGPGAVGSFQTPSGGGGWTQIATATGSGQATLELEGTLTGYKAHILILKDIVTSASGALFLGFGIGTGPVVYGATKHLYSQGYTAYDTTSYTGEASAASAAAFQIQPAQGYALLLSGQVTMQNIASSAKIKPMIGEFAHGFSEDPSGCKFVHITGAYISATAITGLQLSLGSSRTFSSGTATLYGIN